MMNRGGEKQCAGCDYMIAPIKKGYDSSCKLALCGLPCCHRPRYVAVIHEQETKKKRRKKK